MKSAAAVELVRSATARTYYAASESQPGVAHAVTVDWISGRWATACTCRGWASYHNCRHVALAIEAERANAAETSIRVPEAPANPTREEFRRMADAIRDHADHDSDVYLWQAIGLLERMAR